MNREERDAQVLAKARAIITLLGGDEEDVWLAPAKAARMTGLTPKRLSQMAKDGTLTTMLTPGGIRRYQRSQLAALMEQWEADNG